MPSSLTTRELRGIAAILDGLNKARAVNVRMGVPTTPDVFTAHFPNGFVSVVRWVEGLKSDDPKRQRVLELNARHRDGYVVDLASTPDLDNLVPLKDPQPATRGRNVRTNVVERVDAAVKSRAVREYEQRQRLGLE